MCMVCGMIAYLRAKAVGCWGEDDITGTSRWYVRCLSCGCSREFSDYHAIAKAEEVPTGDRLTPSKEIPVWGPKRATEYSHFQGGVN